MKHRIALMAVFIATLLCAAAEISPDVPFPDAFRSWRHVKTVVGGGNIFQFYANPLAVEGYRAGKFPNGSILVRETLHAVPGDGEAARTLNEGERTGVDVMAKDDHLYTATGGWGYERFDANKTRASPSVRAQCYTCHSRQKDRDFVFTRLAVFGGTPHPKSYRH